MDMVNEAISKGDPNYYALQQKSQWKQEHRGSVLSSESDIYQLLDI